MVFVTTRDFYPFALIADNERLASLLILSRAITKHLESPGGAGNQASKIMQAINILLVDDDRDDYELFQISLESILNRSYNLVWKQNGVEALSYLNSGSFAPDLIVMDLNMPLKDGFQTLSELKASQKFASIPVHIFTTSVDHLNKCRSLGCTGYFRKPVSLDGYKLSVQTMLTGEYFPAEKKIRERVSR